MAQQHLTKQLQMEIQQSKAPIFNKKKKLWETTHLFAKQHRETTIHKHKGYKRVDAEGKKKNKRRKTKARISGKAEACSRTDHCSK